MGWNRYPTPLREPHACEACGTWRCKDCGWKRQRANRYFGPQLCGRCKSGNGEMLEIWHGQEARWDHDDELEHRLARKFELAKYPVKI